MLSHERAFVVDRGRELFLGFVCSSCGSFYVEVYAATADSICELRSTFRELDVDGDLICSRCLGGGAAPAAGRPDGGTEGRPGERSETAPPPPGRPPARRRRRRR